MEAVKTAEGLAVAAGDMALNTIASADAQLMKIHQDIWAMYSHAKAHLEELRSLRTKFDFCDNDQRANRVKERLDQMIANAEYDLETCWQKLHMFDEYYHAKTLVFAEWRDELAFLNGRVTGLSQSLNGNLIEARSLMSALNCI